MRDFVRAAYRVLAIALGHLSRDDGWAMASHLALSSLMALFPFLIFVAALAAFIGQQQLADQVTDLVFQAWPPEIANPISDEVHRVLGAPSRNILTISILVTIYLASNGVEAVRMGLNRAYRVTEARSIFVLRLQSILFVIIGALSSLSIAILGVLGPLLWSALERRWPALSEFRSNFTVLRYAVLSLVLIFALVAAHLWLPAKRPPAVRLWPGILTTLIGWWACTSAFATYLENFANYTATYAGLASVVAAIFFLYLLGFILIFGAEFNSALAIVRDERETVAKETTGEAGRRESGREIYRSAKAGRR